MRPEHNKLAYIGLYIGYINIFSVYIYIYIYIYIGLYTYISNTYTELLAVVHGEFIG